MSDCEMIDVMSTNISRIGYIKGECILRVQFESGTIGDYFPVSIEEFEAIKNAPSKGKHFSKYIKPVKLFTPVSVTKQKNILEDTRDVGQPTVNVKNPTEKSLRFDEKTPRIKQTSNRIQDHFTLVKNALREKQN